MQDFYRLTSSGLHGRSEKYTLFVIGHRYSWHSDLKIIYLWPHAADIRWMQLISRCFSCNLIRKYKSRSRRIWRRRQTERAYVLRRSPRRNLVVKYSFVCLLYNYKTYQKRPRTIVPCEFINFHCIFNQFRFNKTLTSSARISFNPTKICVRDTFVYNLFCFFLINS